MPNLNYPIILVHGIGASDQKGRSWGKIPETLEDHGIELILGNTDAWGTYESNAVLLKATIESVLQERGVEKVNIIAHSKGGIDSRYLIWRYDFGDKVASLSTVCTPHKGSIIADMIYDNSIIHKEPFLKLWELIGEWYQDSNPDMYNAGYQLTTKHMQSFNETVPPDKRVYYHSYYTKMEDPFDDIFLSEPYRILKQNNGDNDGLVSVESAMWGEESTYIPGRLSHRDIVGLGKTLPHGNDIASIYLGIINTLRVKGF
ncbi:MAG: hypothetical protein LBQ77_06950 [Treponema sp.]|jgi:triacylglycerol lipase|nr:hypothetical protein [Treponema sp.]